MPIKAEREYRIAQPFTAQDADFIVEGYASTFEPYVMWEEDGKAYSERIDIKAFDEADMSDVILQYDHEGRVYARQSNGTLEVNPDDKGLKIRADLSRTDSAKSLYQEIKAGMITQMSFAFTVAQEHYEKDTRTRVIDRIKKVYDVSAVSLPANPDTEISARSVFGGFAETEKQEMRQAEERKKRIDNIKSLLGVKDNGN